MTALGKRNSYRMVELELPFGQEYEPKSFTKTQELPTSYRGQFFSQCFFLTEGKMQNHEKSSDILLK